jgi:hypothetical protein
MNVLFKLWGALRALADNVLALSATVAEVNGCLLARLALDAPPDAQGGAPAALEHRADPESARAGGRAPERGRATAAACTRNRRPAAG